MVLLSQTSSIDGKLFPTIRKWDELVRQNWKSLQNLIDRHTYSLQRAQRFLFSVPYPRGYASEINDLALLKAKQQVGEVTKQEVDQYSQIEPRIRSYYKQTFGGFFRIPIGGTILGAGFFLAGTAFNWTIPVRACGLLAPIVLDWWRTQPDSLSTVRCTQFLQWVAGYRRAQAFNELHKDIFNNPETRKVIGNKNLVELGEQLIKLTQSSPN